MVARGLAWGKGSAHCRGHGGNYTVTKKLFFSVICSQLPGGVRVGEQAGAQQARGCDHRGVLAPGWGPEGQNTRDQHTKLLSQRFLSPDTKVFACFNISWDSLLPLCGLYSP